MRTTSFTTSIEIAGFSVEADVSYMIHPGYPGSRIDPPEDASVEVTEIVLHTSKEARWAPDCHGTGKKLDPIPDWLFEMIAEHVEEDCFEDDKARHEGALEYLADLARDRELEDR